MALYENGVKVIDGRNMGGRAFINTFEFWRALSREGFKDTWLGSLSSSAVVSGSGTTFDDVDTMSVDLGGTHASTAGKRRNVKAFPNTAGTFKIDWSKKMFFEFRIEWKSGATLAATTVRMLLTASSNIEAMVEDGLGLISSAADIGLATYGSDGTEERVSAGVNLVIADPVRILIEHDPGVATRLYVNGVLKATQSSTTDIPTGDSTNQINVFLSVDRSGAADTGSENVEVTSVTVGGEF